jgi:hypothetical protein
MPAQIFADPGSHKRAYLQSADEQDTTAKPKHFSDGPIPVFVSIPVLLA